MKPRIILDKSRFLPDGYALRGRLLSNFFVCAVSAALSVSMTSLANAQAPSQQEEPGSSEVFLRADRLIDDAENRQIIAEGDVEARYGERLLRADRVIYDLGEKYVRAQGNVQIIDPEGTVRYADEIQVDESLENGFALNFSTRMEKGALAMAKSAVREEGSVNALERMVYTTCKICEEKEGGPTWVLRAKKAVQNQETEMISYQGAVLEIKGVPVFYLPYFAHPDPTSSRRSGLLPPGPGVSSQHGGYYKQPYLHVLSESQDITIAPTVFEKVNPLLGVEYRKRFYSGHLSVNATGTHEKLFNNDGERNENSDASFRSNIAAQGKFKVNQDWRWGFGIERQSDDLYDRRYDIRGVNATDGLFRSQTRSMLSQIYAIGQTEDFYTEAGVLSFQGLRANELAGESPLVSPTLYTEKMLDFGRYGAVSLSGSSAVIGRDIGVSSARGTLEANWRLRRIAGPGLVVEPFVETRGDIYDVSDTTDQLPDTTEARLLGLAGAEVSWPLVGKAGVFDFTVEPTIMAAFGSDSPNDSDIPNEDALRFEADETNLFSPNGASNYDLWEGGNRFSAGVSASARWGKNNRANMIFGRRWRETADDQFDVASNLNETDSDFVTSFGVNMGRSFALESRLRLDDETLDLQRVDSRLAMNVWRLNASAQYFSLSEELKETGAEEGLLLNSKFRLTDNWSAVYGVARNIEERRNQGAVFWCCICR